MTGRSTHHNSLMPSRAATNGFRDLCNVIRQIGTPYPRKGLSSWAMRLRNSPQPRHIPVRGRPNINEFPANDPILNFGAA